MYFDQTEFGKRIKHLRNEKGMIQEDLAPELHISMEHLKKLEGGSRRASYELLGVISDYFDVSIDYLLTGREHYSQATRMRFHSVIAELQAISGELP